MKKLIALMLSIFTILLVSTSAFAFSGGGISGGVNGDGDFTGGGFSGGSRLSSVFGSSPPASSSLSTMLSYEALNNLTANINLGISLGEIEILDGNIQAVTVTKRTDWNAYVITGVYNGNTYVIVNASGGRYYSPINEGYSVVAIAGVSNYYLTNRPAGTTGNGYLGDLYLTYDNWLNIQSTLNNLTGDKSYYTYGHSINGEFRYYLANRPSTTTYYVCNSAGQLFYTIKDTGSSEDTGGGGSTFDPTEVITAINSVYDAINSQGSRLANGLSQLTITANTISDILNLHMNNVVDGFGDIQNSLSTLNSYFTDLSGLFPVQETITLLGSDTRVAWDSADRITGVKTSGFDSGDLTVKTNSGPLIDESGYQNVKLSPDTTEYTLSTVDGYRRITAANEYPDTGAAVPDGALFYCDFDNDSLVSSVGDLQFSVSGGGASYASGLSGNSFVFNGSNYIYSDTTSFPALNQSFTLSFWVYVTEIPPNGMTAYHVGGYGMSLDVSVRYNGRLGYTISSENTTYQGSTINAITVNSWNNIALTFDGSTGYGFVNGVLDVSFTASGLASSNSYFYIGNSSTYFPSGSMVDEVIFVNGTALWTSSFDAENEAIFSAVAADYFLPCTNQNIGLVFDDTFSKTFTPTDVNGNAITMGRLEDDFSEIYMDISTMMWYCHDPQTQTEILLSSANQQIMNDTIYVRQNYTILPADQITADALQNLLPVDSLVYLDMPEGAKLTITYDHYSGWFRMMYILMDKQTKLLSDLDIVSETIINVENTVIDITNNNPAYNVFYITKTDGTTESVGDAAKDAAVFVGDVLSMFYRLVFDDALDNTGIIKDFEDTLTSTNSGVNVW